MSEWSTKQAYKRYNLAYWGGDYFSISDSGHLVAHPDRKSSGPGIDLYDLANDLQEQGITLPVLVRFTDILRDRVDSLCGAFEKAIDQQQYRGHYRAVYPIKVNQQRSVVDAIFQHGASRVGLEAGSKPELMAVLALSDTHGGTIVCNGYKDSEYIRLALIGRRLGYRIHIVIEKPSELELVLRESAQMGIEPLLGLRVKLASIGAGKWQNTGGEKSKFGLSASQMLAAVERLQQAGMSHCLQMLHCHLGSQIANITDIQRGMREVARYYAELHRLGVALSCVDVGGGLGVDYEGTRSRSFCSINYSLEEYANNVVHTLWEICEENNLPHPDIFSESGRAMTAHHAALLTNVIDVGQLPNTTDIPAPEEDAPLLLQDMWNSYQQLAQADEERLSDRSLVESYHDVHHWLNELQAMYTTGVINLEQRAAAEEIYYATCRKVQSLLQPGKKAHREILDELNDKLADKYFCNFSLFQSVPDVWAIEQVFPVLPIHRLDEEPLRRGVLEDITCDSDGRIDHYVDNDGVETSMPLHDFSQDQRYFLGIFLVGAYQEILGDLHNLFGDTNSVHVELKADGSSHISRILQGDKVDDVLRYVHFDSRDLQAMYREKVTGCDASDEEKQLYLQELEAGLHGYTYLED